MTITDDDGVEVTIPEEPERIVTFAPSMTEIVYALGVGDRLVGVSGPFDDYPAEAADVEEVGGAGDFGVDPNVEKVISLEPDLFLTISGGDQWKERLRDLDVPVVTLNAEDFADLLDDIRAVGRTGATGGGRVARRRHGGRSRRDRRVRAPRRVSSRSSTRRSRRSGRTRSCSTCWNARGATR